MDSILPERLLALVRPGNDLVLRRIRSLKRCVQACGCKIMTPRYAPQFGCEMRGSQHSMEDHRLISWTPRPRHLPGIEASTPAAPPARHRSLPPGRFESISATYAFQHHIPARQSRASPTWRLRYLARHLPGIVSQEKNVEVVLWGTTSTFFGSTPSAPPGRATCPA